MISLMSLSLPPLRWRIPFLLQASGGVRLPVYTEGNCELDGKMFSDVTLTVEKKRENEKPTPSADAA